jgi:hypothetical protein
MLELIFNFEWIQKHFACSALRPQGRECFGAAARITGKAGFQQAPGRVDVASSVFVLVRLSVFIFYFQNLKVLSRTSLAR